MLAYHATDAIFDDFEPAKAGEFTAQNTNDKGAIEAARLGVWLSDHDIRSRTREKYLLEVAVADDLRLWDEGLAASELFDLLTDTDAETMRDELTEQGYAGMVIDDDEFGGKSYIIFDAADARIVRRYE